MLSKMTFSLVLVFAFALTLVATSVDAQTYVDLGAQTDIKGKFVVISKIAPSDGLTGTHGFPDTVDVATTAVVEGPAFIESPTTNMPEDLRTFLQDGGTIEVLVKVGDFKEAVDDVAAVGPRYITTKNAAIPAEVDKLKHAVMVSEIMWAENRSADVVDGHWIELFVNSTGAIGSHTAGSTGDDDDLIIADIVIVFHDRKVSRFLTKVTLKATDPGVDATLVGDYIVVDSVSRVPRFGGAWELPGQNGNTVIIAAVGGVGAIEPTSLISMYRKADVESGKYKADLVDAGGVGIGTEGGSWVMSAGQNAYIEGYFIGSPGGVHVSFGGQANRYTKNTCYYCWYRCCHQRGAQRYL